MHSALQNIISVGIFCQRTSNSWNVHKDGGRMHAGQWHIIMRILPNWTPTRWHWHCCINVMSHRALWPGRDEAGLSCWSWVWLWGNSGQVLQIISAYQPCVSLGPLSTYQQQVWYLAKNDHMDLPKATFLVDLAKVITEWQAEGNMVIVTADMNNDIWVNPITAMLRTVGLTNGPTTLHQHPPAMHNKGSNPINGIFLPITLIKHCKSGYLAFGDAVPSNHQVLWLDIPAQCICPIKQVAIEHPPAQRLQCRDPRVMLKYNMLLWDSLNLSGMAARAQILALQNPTT